MGDDSLHWKIAWIACETGISPLDLMQLEPRMLWTVGRYLEFKIQKQNQRKR